MRFDISRNSRDYYISLLMSIILLVLVPGEFAAGQERNWLNIGISGSPVSQDVKEVKDSLTLSVIQNTVFENLVRYGGDRNLTIEPAIATSWEIKNGGKVWEFTIRQGIRFHDGSILTPADIVDSFERDPGFTGRVEATGGNVVRMIFPEKRAGFMKNLNVVSSAVNKLLPDGRIVGTGPFRISFWEPETMVELEAFDEYWGGRPILDGVTYHCGIQSDKGLEMMKSGELDVVDIVPPSMSYEYGSDPDLVLSILEGVNVSFVHINLQNPPLDSAEFRRVLNMLIHTEKIIKDVHFDQAIRCKGLLPPVIGGKKDGPPRIVYDHAAAKKVILRYAESLDRPLKMVGLPFPRPYCPDPAAQARLITGYLRGAGLKIEYVASKSMEEYVQKMSNGDYDLAISGWVIDSRNPDDFYTLIFGVGQVESIFSVGWENEDFENLVMRARQTVSVKRQWDLYHEADDLFFTDFPWILIAHTNQLGAYRKNIAGLQFSPTGEFRLHTVEKRSIN